MAIQRIVCFKFTETASEQERQSHMRALAALKDAIPQIASYSGGFSISGDFDSAPKYDTLHYLTFAAMEDVDVYFNHPVHQQFVADYRHLWADVLVLNADIAE